jgi:cobalt/nickel transport system permease protein
VGSNHEHQSLRDHHGHNIAKPPWEPRTKLIAGLIYIFGVISLGDIRLLAGALIFALIFAVIGGLTSSQLANKFLLLMPFMILMSLPLLLGAGYPPPVDRIEMTALILLKALTAMTFTLFIFTNQPIENMLEALEHLKVPAVVATVIYLAYRYGFLFIHEMQTTIRALKARLFRAELSRGSLPVYGEVSGGLFIKSLNRSETVYRAMASRGFQGRMPVGAPRRIRSGDLVRAALPPLFIITLLVIEQVVL